jgi:hypothetical protein
MPPLPITGYAPLNGWRQVGAPHWSFMEAHTFESSPKGELLHFTNGELRATVPPEGFAEFCAAWPMAQPIVDQVTRASSSQTAGTPAGPPTT